ncbi:unnamed protein product [Thlaspi arvense]|uniref:Cytochrome b5 heme-binding domain-containing protein n=1 Tax=Thlaspi arvense TaxID=13288 RepID=A0AAU9RTM9_THLAR|nr:unnamed protein product [Thlaspi arvense]
MREEVEPLPPPVQVGEITEEELKAYDGTDPEKPLLMAIKGQIYDVSQSRLLNRSARKKTNILASIQIQSTYKGNKLKATAARVDKGFYGPGGPYALFAGKDASRALAKLSFEEKDLTGDISGLGPFELDALQDWEYKFMTKYVKVGTVKKTVPVTEGSSTGEPAEGTDHSVEKRAENGSAESHAENGTTENAEKE